MRHVPPAVNSLICSLFGKRLAFAKDSNEIVLRWGSSGDSDPGTSLEMSISYEEEADEIVLAIATSMRGRGGLDSEATSLSMTFNGHGEPIETKLHDVEVAADEGLSELREVMSGISFVVDMGLTMPADLAA